MCEYIVLFVHSHTNVLIFVIFILSQKDRTELCVLFYERCRKYKYQEREFFYPKMMRKIQSHNGL